MELIKATNDNRLFQELEAQWQGQHADYDDNFDGYLAPYREQSKRVIEEDPSTYSVYVLSHEGSHDGFMHINHAMSMKGVQGPTLRVVEIFLAPKYDYEDISSDVMAEMCASIFTELIRLSEDESKSLRADNIKIHMGPLEKSVFTSFARFYNNNNNLDVSTHGSWLVIKKRA